MRQDLGDLGVVLDRANKHEVQFERFGDNNRLHTSGLGDSTGIKTSVIDCLDCQVSAALILVVGLWLAFFISKVVRRKALDRPRIDATLGTFLSVMIRYALIILVLIVVLQQLLGSARPRSA